MKEKILLLSEDTLKTYSLIDSTIDGKYILPAIEIAQKTDLQNLIGAALYSKIISLIEDNTINEEVNKKYKYLLDEYITDYLVWQTMSTIQVNLNYKFKQSGMVQNTDTNKANIDFSNSMALASQYEKYANTYATRMKDYLLANINLYPEYTKCKNFEYAMDAPLCSIFLEDLNKSYNYKYK